jgi:hypothetical protein
MLVLIHDRIMPAGRGPARHDAFLAGCFVAAIIGSFRKMFDDETTDGVGSRSPTRSL